MVEVGGVRLIERALYILDKKNLSRIVMVVGYQCENLMQFVDGLGIDTPVEYIINEVYDRTNNIYSLSMAKDWLVKEDTLLLESDLIFEEAQMCIRDSSIIAAMKTIAGSYSSTKNVYSRMTGGACIRFRS